MQLTLASKQILSARGDSDGIAVLLQEVKLTIILRHITNLVAGKVALKDNR